MSPPETAPSNDNGSGFQRGFLLKKQTTKTKSQLRPKSTNPLPSKPTSESESSNLTKSTTKAVRVNEKNAEKDAPKPLACKKKDLGWATGFLNSKQERKPTSTEKSRNVSTSKKSKPSIKTDSGWSKGFLTNNNTTKQGKKTKDGTKRNEPAKLYASETERGQSKSESRSVNQASSDVLLAIGDGDGGDFQYKNVGKMISPIKIAPTTAPTNNDRSPLISVIFDQSANETDSGATGIEELDFNADSNKNPFEGNREGTSADFATKSVITPLISIRKDEEGCDEEEDSSPIFLKEVSTTRILKYKEGESAELPDSTEEKTSSQLNHKPIFTTSSSDLSIKRDTQGHNMVSSPKDDKDSDCKSILEIQLQLESLLSGSTKISQPNDFEAKIQSQLKTLDHRRPAWIYLLQQRQQRQHNRRKQRLKNSMEQYECDYRIRVLFDFEFWSDNDGTTDSEIGLESVLVRLETESERRMALEVLLMIQEYFVFRHKEQERDRQSEVQRSSRKTIAHKMQAKAIERVIQLFIRVANLALENRRTMLAQTAWETSILMSCFCIRKGSELPQSEIGVAPTTVWATLDSLLQQQLAWQKSKTKQNKGKIDQLQEIRVDSNNVLKGLLYAHPEVPNLVTRLEKLIGM